MTPLLEPGAYKVRLVSTTTDITGETRATYEVERPDATLRITYDMPFDIGGPVMPERNYLVYIVTGQNDVGTPVPTRACSPEQAAEKRVAKLSSPVHIAGHGTGLARIARAGRATPVLVTWTDAIGEVRAELFRLAPKTAPEWVVS